MNAQNKLFLLYKYPLINHLNYQTMKKNMGTLDKVIRIIVAVVFAALYFTKTVEGTPGIILLVLSIIFVQTSLVGICPIYLLFGISSRK